MKPKELINAAATGQEVTQAQLAALLTQEDATALFQRADEVCRQNFGDEVQIRAILEFSNHCRRHCCYCGLNAGNTEAARYRMQPADIIRVSVEAWEAGYQTIVLQSGEDPYYTKDMVCEIVTGIKAQCPIFITLSIGERPYDELKAFRACGADRYLLKHETADAQIYRTLHPCGTLQERVDCLKNIKSLGYETGSGFMIGLPGQTAQTIAKDLLLLRELRCDMAGIGPFIPHPQTPLHHVPAGSTDMTKRAVALARLLLPKANLPATTSLGVLDSGEKALVFSCGANIIMRKVTPWDCRKQYEIYPSDLGETIDIRTARCRLEQEIKQLGKIPI